MMAWFWLIQSLREMDKAVGNINIIQPNYYANSLFQNHFQKHS